jgi:uncharacterized protein
MDMNRIVQSIVSEYRLNLRGTHGVWHWLRVRSNGLVLADATPGADREVVELFALLHDSQRFDEYEDIEHGARAAAFVKRLSAEGIVTLERARLQTLMKACAWHTIEKRSKDPTIGCCYDADRLDLSRLGNAPDDRYMSTVASADPELRRIAWGRGYHRIEDAEAARRLGFPL